MIIRPWRRRKSVASGVQASSEPGAGRLRRLLVAFAWISFIAAASGAAFVFSFIGAMKSELRATQVEVPTLASLELAEAESRAESLGLRLEVVDRRHDPAVASGRVLQQDPRVGDTVRRGRRVKVVLSLGGRVLEVPNLVGHADRAVEIELRRDGFLPGDEARVHSRSVLQGRILAQVPAAGSPTVPRTRVHRLVSEGPRESEYVMPDLTGLSKTAAERWIERYGFRRGAVRRIPSPGSRAGTVVGQLPLAGYPVRASAVVELSVAR